MELKDDYLIRLIERMGDAGEMFCAANALTALNAAMDSEGTERLVLWRAAYKYMRAMMVKLGELASYTIEDEEMTSGMVPKRTTLLVAMLRFSNGERHLFYSTAEADKVERLLESDLDTAACGAGPALMPAVMVDIMDDIRTSPIAEQLGEQLDMEEAKNMRLN